MLSVCLHPLAFLAVPLQAAVHQVAPLHLHERVHGSGALDEGVRVHSHVEVKLLYVRVFVLSSRRPSPKT